MKVKKKDILEKWLKIEFYSVANKARLISKKQDVDEEILYDTITDVDTVLFILFAVYFVQHFRWRSMMMFF